MLVLVLVSVLVLVLVFEVLVAEVLVFDVAELLVPDVFELLVPDVSELLVPDVCELEEPLDVPPRTGSLGACRPVANASAAVRHTPMTKAERTVTTFRNVVLVRFLISAIPLFSPTRTLQISSSHDFHRWYGRARPTDAQRRVKSGQRPHGSSDVGCLG